MYEGIKMSVRTFGGDTNEFPLDIRLHWSHKRLVPIDDFYTESFTPIKKYDKGSLVEHHLRSM